MINNTLPHSAAAERNKEVIAEALAMLLKQAASVLEIGSGTGQHAAYFCTRFPQLHWQPTEQQQHLDNLRRACEESGLSNIQLPVVLEVSAAAEQLPDALSSSAYTFVYSANTAHIMALSEVADMFRVVQKVLSEDGVFALYGPFNLDGQYSSESNREFDSWLKSQGQHMGIRDITELKTLGQSLGLELQESITMPANNQILLWKVVSSV